MAAGTLGASYKLLVALGVASGGSAAAIIVSFAASIEAVFWSHIEVAARSFIHFLAATPPCTTTMREIMSET